MVIADIDISVLRSDRLRNSNFNPPREGVVQVIDCAMEPVVAEKMHRQFNPHPFIPHPENEAEYLGEVFNIQTMGLAKRLHHT